MIADFLIKEALVFDGTGKEPEILDVAGKGGKIMAISPDLQDIEATETITADGMVLCPGFIDVHSHDDFSVFLTPDMEYKIRQGVTTSIVGNCGFSIAPYNDALKQTILYHEKSRMPSWDSFSSYVNCFNKEPAAINIGVLAGLGAFRYAVAKDSKETLNLQEINAVKEMIEQAISEGVIGVSLGLAYFPGKYSNKNELIEILNILKKHRSLFAIHMRDEGHSLLTALEETINISRETEVPVHVSHFKAIGKNNYHLFKTAMEMIEHAISEKTSVTVDLYPFDSGSTALKEVVGWNIFSPDKSKAMFSAETSDIVIVSLEKHPEWIGKNIAQLSEEFRLSHEETAEKIINIEENTLIAIRNCISEENIEAILNKPYSMVGSDGIPTKTGFSNPRLYGTFPRVIGRYSRDRKILDLKNAIYKMTGFPASRFGLKNRGIISKDAAADIVIFDYSKIMDKADYSNPRQYPVGISDVFVNGVRVLCNGEMTGKRAGFVLTGK